MAAYLPKLAVMLDELVNALFDGGRDQTISARAGAARLKGKAWGCVLCAVLDRIQKNHCAQALAAFEAVQRALSRPEPPTP